MQESADSDKSMEDIDLQLYNVLDCVKWLNELGIATQDSKENLKKRITPFRWYSKLVDKLMKKRESVCYEFTCSLNANDKSNDA